MSELLFAGNEKKEIILNAGYVRSKMPETRHWQSNFLAITIFSANFSAYLLTFTVIIFRAFLGCKNNRRRSQRFVYRHFVCRRTRCVSRKFCFKQNAQSHSRKNRFFAIAHYIFGVGSRAQSTASRVYESQTERLSVCAAIETRI